MKIKKNAKSNIKYMKQKFASYHFFFLNNDCLRNITDTINREKSWPTTIIVHNIGTFQLDRSFRPLDTHIFYARKRDTWTAWRCHEAGSGVTGRMNISGDESWSASISFFRAAARHELGRSELFVLRIDRPAQRLSTFSRIPATSGRCGGIG